MIVDKAWKLALSALIGASLIGGVAYWATREPVRVMTPLAQELAAAATSDFAKKLPRVQEVNACLLIVNGRGPRDEGQQLREMLVRAVDGTGKYRLRTWKDITDGLGSNIFGQLVQKLGLAPGEEPSTLPRAVEACKFASTANVELDGVLLVDTNLLEGQDEDGFGTRITLEGQLWGLKAGKLLSDGPRVTEEITSRLDPRYLSYTIGRWSILLRLFTWFVASAGLPWALIRVVRAVARRKDNGLNAGMLVGFTLADLVVFWVLVLALGTGGGSLLGLVLVAGLMGYYNYDACDYISRRLM